MIDVFILKYGLENFCIRTYEVGRHRNIYYVSMRVRFEVLRRGFAGLCCGTVENGKTPF